MINTSTTEIYPMYNQILVQGSGVAEVPSATPGATGPPWFKVFAYSDDKSPNILVLSPPTDRFGKSIVTVELVDGDDEGHRDAGAESVFLGRMTFEPRGPLVVWTPTGGTSHRTPFEVEGDYEVEVAIAGRQQSIINSERRLAAQDDDALTDEEWEAMTPPIEHWWVTLKA